MMVDLKESVCVPLPPTVSRVTVDIDPEGNVSLCLTSVDLARDLFRVATKMTTIGTDLMMQPAEGSSPPS